MQEPLDPDYVYEGSRRGRYSTDDDLTPEQLEDISTDLLYTLQPRHNTCLTTSPTTNEPKPHTT